MFVRKLLRSLGLTSILAVSASSAIAQEPLPPIGGTPTPPTNMVPLTPPPTTAPALPSQLELLKRLEAAEKRIRALEKDLRNSKQYPISQDDKELSPEEKKNKKEEADKKKKDEEEKKKKATEAEKKQDDSIKKQDDRLKKIEEAYKKDKEAKDKAKKKSVQPFQVGGRIHLDSINHFDDSAGIGFFEHSDPTAANFGTDPENRLTFRRIRLSVRGDVLDNMFYKFDWEFADPNDGQFRDVLFGWEDIPFFGTVIVGNQKRPINLDQLNSSNHNVFMGRPYMADAFQEESRRIGLTANNWNENETLTWQYGIFNNQLVQSDGDYRGDPFQGIFLARSTWTPFYDECSGGRNYVHFGLAGSVADFNGRRDGADGHVNTARFRARPEFRTVNRWINTGRIDRADYGFQQAAEMIVNLGPLAIVGEYEFDQVQRDGGRQDVFFHGGYIYVAYFLTGEHQPYNKRAGKINRPKPFENFFLVNRACGKPGGGWGAWQVAARYSYIDTSDADITGGIGSNITLALNWWWNDRSRLMLNYIMGRIDRRGPIGGFDNGNFNALALRFHMDW